MPKLPSDNSRMERLYHEEHDPRYLIIKQNHLVQDTRFTMPLADQKVLASLIRSIKPGQKSLTVKFSVEQYMSMLGMRNTGNGFDEVVNALYHIMNDNFFITKSDGSLVSWIWFDKVHAIPRKHRKSGVFYVRFKPELRKYLLSETLKYHTILRFNEIMFMQSKYSPRLYEILRSNQSRQRNQNAGLDYGIDELHYSLGLYRARPDGTPKKDKNGNVKFKYPRFYNFNKKIIQRSAKEINKFTDNNVKFKPIKQGRKVVAYNVVMKPKTRKQLQNRDKLDFRLSHHMTKKQYRDWYNKVRYGKDKDSDHKHTVEGKFRVVRPSDLDPKEFAPFKEVNMGGGKVEFKNPFTNKFTWASQSDYDKLKHSYEIQKRIMDKIKNRKDK